VTRRGAALGAMVMLVIVCAAPAFGVSGAIGNERPIAVSVPSEAARLGAGERGTIPIRVVNPASTPVTVRIAGHGVAFGNDGRVTMTTQDPIWSGRVVFPARPITIPSHGYRDVGLRVRMPSRITPDLYFIGFIVTPLSDANANLTYVNQVGSYITIDVPGPRTRALAADLQLSGFAISNNVQGTVHIHNVGKAAAVFWGETDTSATPGSATSSPARTDRSLLPQGRSRAITVSTNSAFPIAYVTVRIHIFYPGRTDATTNELTLTKRVLIVRPVALILLGITVFAGALMFVWKRRRRYPRPTARATGAHQKTSRASGAQRPKGSHAGRERARARAAANIDQQLERIRTHAAPSGRRRRH